MANANSQVARETKALLCASRLNTGSPLPAAGEGLGVRGNFIPNQNRERARDLRRRQTEQEQLVWRRLRNRRFADFKFRRQFPLGNHIVDFACLERRLILEQDGGQHAESEQTRYDVARDACAPYHGASIANPNLSGESLFLPTAGTDAVEGCKYQLIRLPIRMSSWPSPKHQGKRIGLFG